VSDVAPLDNNADLVKPVTAEPAPVDSDASRMALQMMIQHGFAGAIYMAAGYGACEISQGNSENEIWWMRVIVAIVSLRDLPVPWRRVPITLLH